MKHYFVKEVFHSPQGEGHRVGTMNVFVRFAGCNLQCVDRERNSPLKGNEVNAGFNCDTDFAKGEKMTLVDLVALIVETDIGRSQNVIFTGGEPALQLDEPLMSELTRRNYRLHIETNGTKKLPPQRSNGYLWTVVSPKPGTEVVVRVADEVRCVVKWGQVPDPVGIRAKHYFASPAFRAPEVDVVNGGWKGSMNDLDPKAVEWVLAWCRENPPWRISLQMHKFLGVR